MRQNTPHARCWRAFSAPLGGLFCVIFLAPAPQKKTKTKNKIKSLKSPETTILILICSTPTRQTRTSLPHPPPVHRSLMWGCSSFFFFFFCTDTINKLPDPVPRILKTTCQLAQSRTSTCETHLASSLWGFMAVIFVSLRILPAACCKFTSFCTFAALITR